MSKKLFDKKFVHFLWDDSLEGKEGFFADNIGDLITSVNNNGDKNIASKSKYQDTPFYEAGSDWRFFYYDPNYECKRAYNEGKQIQISGDGEIWVDWEDKREPDWDTIFLFRIKPEEEPKPKRMTYRMLAEWLAKGNGQQSSTECSVRYTFQETIKEDENKEVPVDYKIRRWNSNEWIEPTVDVYNVDCK